MANISRTLLFSLIIWAIAAKQSTPSLSAPRPSLQQNDRADMQTLLQM